MDNFHLILAQKLSRHCCDLGLVFALECKYLMSISVPQTLSCVILYFWGDPRSWSCVKEGLGCSVTAGPQDGTAAVCKAHSSSSLSWPVFPGEPKWNMFSFQKDCLAKQILFICFSWFAVQQEAEVSGINCLWDLLCWYNFHCNLSVQAGIKLANFIQEDASRDL